MGTSPGEVDRWPESLEPLVEFFATQESISVARGWNTGMLDPSPPHSWMPNEPAPVEENMPFGTPVSTD